MSSATARFRNHVSQDEVDDRRGSIVSIVLVAASMAVASWTLLPGGGSASPTPASTPAASASR